MLQEIHLDALMDFSMSHLLFFLLFLLGPELTRFRVGLRVVRGPSEDSSVLRTVFLHARIWLKADFFEDIHFAVVELHRNHHRAFYRF